ncbi:metalloregulator ArsR/SmtB family transcription factor [Demequina sp. TTPB684]|uniref:ArsR/SmtB family transcription factor n=1 Tax=unclassified Demequina TaxID=2620311 RepID=UPI001CF497C5|nr:MULTISPECIES: metalloregulator ArsR/SmtB family transcription factor [unclassified Demequina]MCB2411373.1 metalloregulator ArsR/SmtB family transcription factor [Demequina sp. TTPB684]UPU89471.1 metalloregulator ArsR/SmtB family transcription factor [Demequina sp. TMPB413]
MNPWNSGFLDPSPPSRDAVARVGRALSNGSRVELLELLAQADRNVGDLASVAGLKLTTASAHLQVLKEAGLVVTRREGPAVTYGLAGPRVLALLTQLYDAVSPAPDDHEALADEVVLDVRPEVEYAHGHFAGALNVPVEDLLGRMPELPVEARYVVYCRDRFCTLSYDAAKILREHGRDVRVARAGALEWRAAGRLVTS